LTPTTEPGSFATRAELAALASAVETQVQSLATSVGDLKLAIETDRAAQVRRDKDLREAIDASTARNRVPMATILTMAGMAAALVVFAISGAVAPVQRDVEENIDELSYQWELTFPRLRWEGETAERIDSLERWSRGVQAYMDDRRGLVERMQDAEQDIRGQDTVLQREMRLLDEVLQREMGLHVDRLADGLEKIENRVQAIERAHAKGSVSP
jgi:hypothetical protein